MLLVKEFPLGFCNLSLVVMGDCLQCGAQVVFLTYHEFLLLKHKTQEDMEGQNGAMLFKACKSQAFSPPEKRCYRNGSAAFTK